MPRCSISRILTGDKVSWGEGTVVLVLSRFSFCLCFIPSDPVGTKVISHLFKQRHGEEYVMCLESHCVISRAIRGLKGHIT